MALGSKIQRALCLHCPQTEAHHRSAKQRAPSDLRKSSGGQRLAHPHQHTKVTSEGARALHTLLSSMWPDRWAVPDEYEHWQPDMEGTAHCCAVSSTAYPASSRRQGVDKGPTPCRAPGRTQIPEVRVRSRGFHPHLVQAT